MTTEYFNHQAAYTAVRICIENSDNSETRISTGTGFFYLASIQLSEEDTRSKLLLISNKHVLEEGLGKMTLTLNRKKEDGTPDYGVLRTFTLNGFANLYTSHPDEDVDLACVDVSSISHSDACIKYLDEKFLRPISYERVALGSDVLFVGYPNDYYDTTNNLPLVRKGTLASMPDIDFRGLGNIVIDAQVFGGSSGSPVFVAWDGKYRAPWRDFSYDRRTYAERVSRCAWTWLLLSSKDMCKNSLTIQLLRLRKPGRLLLRRLEVRNDSSFETLPRLQALRR